MACPVSNRAWLVLLFLILVACIANLVAGVLLYFPPVGNTGLARNAQRTQHIAGAAAAHGWPGTTPHAQPWPKPSQWNSEATTGRRYLQVHAQGDTPEERFQMAASQMGWPFPVIQHVQRWWPWDHPTWRMSPNVQDAGLSFVWSGVVLNPLIVAVPPWLIVVAALAGWRYLTRLRRLAARQCVACGYPVGVLDRCTECGATLDPALAGK